jgi:hypothetical protein
MPKTPAAPMVECATRLLTLLALLTALAPGTAAADSDDKFDGRPVMARLFLGLENGVSVAVATPDRALTAEVAQAFMPSPFNFGRLTEASVAARTSRVGGWLGARLGYQLGVFDYPGRTAGTTVRDVSHTGDIGVLLGATSESGHSIALELGVEAVSRADFSPCCDSTLPTSSRGDRILLVGEYALNDRVGLFTRMGVRYGSHVLELGLLPILMLGVQMNL